MVLQEYFLIDHLHSVAMPVSTRRGGSVPGVGGLLLCAPASALVHLVLHRGPGVWYLL